MAAAIPRARQSLQASPDGELTLGYRQLICGGLGPCWDFTDASGSGRAYRMRVNLAVLTMQKVLPWWEHAWPDNRLPHQLLNAASDVMNGTRDRKNSGSAADSAWTECDNIAFQHQDPSSQLAVLVGYGAVQALRMAVVDRSPDPETVNLALSDADVDPDEIDPFGCAAMVWAGGALWGEKSDPTKRREFWEWWLGTAIPTVAEL